MTVTGLDIQVPAELRERPQWVIWRREPRGEKMTKVPYRGDHPTRHASATDPGTWTTFARAVAASSDADGIGFVFSPDDPYAGVDLDDCFDGVKLHPGAAEIVGRLDSYTERSPSGNGVHVIVRAALKGTRNRTGKTPWGAEFETYDRGRYFCITGECGRRTTIEERQAELDEVVRSIFPVVTGGTAGPVGPRQPLDLDDAELLERARSARNGAEFDALYRGDHDFGSASEADLALCSRLAFWTGGDPQRIDRLFRGSALVRDKWNREDYRQRTIALAIEGCREFYEPRKSVERRDRDTSVTDRDTSSVQSTAAPKFIARRLGEALRRETPVAVSASGHLCTFQHGAYRPGEIELKSRIVDQLGDDWKKSRVDETLGWLRDSSQRLWVDPPCDRINCANGIVDLDGNLEPHSPDFLSPLQIPVTFDPEAECPAIENFLGEVLAPDLIEVVFELAGYLTIPDQRLQLAFLMLGEGAAGKSTLLSTLVALIGRQNVSNVALHRLDEDRFAVAELEGKLANVFADLDARALQASSMFKSITGGDRVTAERKYSQPFSFEPYARLLFSANEPPPTPDSSDAFFRRWLILPFERRFDPGKADRHLLDRLTTPVELSGLLNHGLARLPDLQRRGAFAASDSREAAKERFRTDSDSVAGFLDDACRVDPDARTPKPRLYAAYKEWCAESARKPKGKQKFNRQIGQRFGEVALQGIRHWDGLALEGSL